MVDLGTSQSRSQFRLWFWSIIATFALLFLVGGVITEVLEREIIESVALVVAVAVWISYTLYARKKAYAET